MNKCIYIVDTSSLIEMKVRYPFDIFPQLWNNIKEINKNGRLIAPFEVKKEIEKGDDELVKWIKKQKNLFIKPNNFQVEKVKEILEKSPFLAKAEETEANADPWLIAVAIEKKQENELLIFKNDYFILTEESKVNPNRIPFVARSYNIECINIIELFRKEKWKF